LSILHVLPLLLALGACQSSPDDRRSMPGADPAAGLAAIRGAGCGSCHRIPGLDWPRGEVGPALDAFADQNLIAGRLPNRPDVLAAYVRNAPALTPGTTMPAMPISAAEARDVAAYLYTLSDD
jgi:cytochrome c1